MQFQHHHDAYGILDVEIATRRMNQEEAEEQARHIKLRVPEEYLGKIQNHAKKKGLSVNKLIISLLEEEIGEKIVTIREKNKLEKESEEQ